MSRKFNAEEVAAMITVGNILDHKRDGDLTGWCERVRKMILSLGTPLPQAREVGSVAYARVRVDTHPDIDGWCFCTPFNHPDDLIKGDVNEASQFFGQAF